MIKQMIFFLTFLLIIPQTSAISFGAAPDKIYFNDYNEKTITIFNLGNTTKFSITPTQEWIKTEKEIIIEKDSNKKLIIKIDNPNSKQAMLYIKPLQDNNLVPSVGIKIYNNISNNNKITGNIILDKNHSKNGIAIILFIVVTGLTTYFLKRK